MDHYLVRIHILYLLNTKFKKILLLFTIRILEKILWFKYHNFNEYSGNSMKFYFRIKKIQRNNSFIINNEISIKFNIWISNKLLLAIFIFLLLV
jgi:hypothetical protein